MTSEAGGEMHGGQMGRCVCGGWGWGTAPGGDSGPFWTGCVNTILKEMGPFSASSEWHEWTNFHLKMRIQDEPYFLLYSLVQNMAHPECSIGPPF